MKETKQMKIMSIFIYKFRAWDWTLSSINLKISHLLIIVFTHKKQCSEEGWGFIVCK